MSEWWTYSLSDFLLFSPRTYYRLVQLYNLAIWPAQLVALAIGAAILAVLGSRATWQGRIIMVVLAFLWVWVAWAYFLERYETINWAASYYAAGFMAEAVLLLWRAAFPGVSFRPNQNLASRAGLVISASAMFLYPLIAPALQRPWTQAETFGIMCVISSATLWAMDSVDALIPMLATCFVVVLAIGRAGLGNKRGPPQLTFGERRRSVRGA